MPSQTVADNTAFPWSRYYGQPPYIPKEMLNAEYRKQTSAPDLPSAYIGVSNYYIPSIVEELVWTTDNWYTTVAAPIRFTDVIDWKFNKTTYDQRLPRNTPHKGTSRILEFRKTQQSGRLHRVGLAYEMEADFMDTAAGQEHYAFTLNQLANGIIMDINIGVINAYLNANAYRRRLEQTHGMPVSTDFADKIATEIEMWAIIQKRKNGLKKLDTLADEMMKSWQGSANMWIFPPKVKQWVTLVPPENTDFYMTGNRTAIDSTDASVPQGSLNGRPVYLCRMQDTSMEFGGKRNLLARQREIGSFYTMTPGHHRSCSDDFYSHYQSCFRDIRVYDEPNDDPRAMLTLRAAHENCHIYDKEGNVELPRHDRSWANLADRSKDMLSYDDESGTRRPARLLGHISRNHFSTKSTLDLCKTVAGYARKCDGPMMESGCVETALKEGMELFRKISERKVTLNWFFNVLVERFLKSGQENTPLSEDGNLDKKGWRRVYESITNVTKRTATPSRMVGNIFLPSYDYYSSVNGAEDQPKASAAAMANATAKAGLLGGNTGVGTLAGFGNWDGFLALQAELNSGSGSSTGYTRHGYLKADCEIADRFVKAIRAISKNLQFLFENDFYLNSARAANYVENPTVEHVIAENVLGLGGLPVWLDVTAISNITGSRRREVSSTGAANPDPFSAYLGEARRSSDVSLSMTVAALDAFKGKNVKRSEIVDGLKKKLGLVFGTFGQSLRGDINKNSEYLRAYSSYAINRPINRFLRNYFPFANVSIYSATYESLAERRLLVDVMSRFIMDNPGLQDTEKIQVLDAFLNKVLSLLGLETVLSDVSEKDDRGNSMMTSILRSDSSYDDDELNALFRSRQMAGFDHTKFVPKRSPSDATMQVLRWITNAKNAPKIVEGVKNVMDIGQYVLDAERDLAEAVNTDRNHLESDPEISPILHMTGMAALSDEAIGDVETGKTSERFVAGRFGDEGGRSRDTSLRDAEASVKETKFYRSSLTLSSSQIAELKDIIDNTQLSDAAVMQLRISDPSDPAEKYTEPGRMASLVKRIEELNGSGRGGKDPHSSGGGITSLQHEPYYLFHPDKAIRRDVTLASMVGKLESARKYTSLQKGLGGPTSRTRGHKRSRTSPDVMAPRKSQKIYSSRVMAKDYGSESDDSMEGGSGGGTRGDYDYGTITSRKGAQGFGGFEDAYAELESGGGKRDYYPGEGDMEDDLDDMYDAVDVGSFRKTVGIDSSNNLLTPELIASIIELGGSTNSLYMKLIGKVYLTSALNKRTLEKFIDNDILFPFGFLVGQFHKRYVAYAGILLQGGENTAVTLVGHSGLALQNDASTKTHFGHFTTYDQTVVKKEDNVLVVYDIFIDGTLGGAGIDPIHPDYYEPSEGKTGGGSLIYIMIPYEEEIESNVIDATGRFAAAADGNYVDQKRMNLSTYSQNWRANLKWHFRHVDVNPDCDVPIDGNAPTSNFVAIRGQQYNYHIPTKDYTDYVSNKGHMGPEGEGSLAGRKGGLEMFVKSPVVQLGR